MGELIGQPFEHVAENHFADCQTSVGQHVFQTELIGPEPFLDQTDNRGQRREAEFFP